MSAILKPRSLAQIAVPARTLSRKVRVESGIMLVNRGSFRSAARIGFQGGLEVYDVTRPADPDT
jgi:hypothetical protein